MNNVIQASKKELWLPIEYDSIRYLIVPTVKDRMDLIEFIVNLPSENFIENALRCISICLLAKLWF